MFRIPESALAYERYRRLLEEVEEDPNAQQEQPQAEGQNPNAQQEQPMEQQEQPQAEGQNPNVQQGSMDGAQTPEQAYESGLKEIQNTIATTGRKRYSRYKMNGGKDSWEVFKRNLEDSLKQELENDCKEMFGYNPGTATEKDILVMIKNGIDQLNQAMQMQANSQEDPNAQQAMQEAYDYISEMQYRNFMRRNRLF